MKTKVITDSGSGLSKTEAEKLGIEFLPLQIITENAQYQDGVNVDSSAVIELLKNGSFPKTSQPGLQNTEEILARLEKEGVTDLIAVTLSSALSSTNDQLQAFARQHGIKIHNVEPYSTLYIQQHLALEAKRMLYEGEDPEKIVEKLQKLAEKCHTYVVVEDLKHLAAGGRLGPAAAAIGSVLKIKPLLELGKETEGKVELSEKIRTFSKALKRMTEKAKEVIEPDKQYIVYVGDGGSGNAEQLKEEIMNINLENQGNLEIRTGEIFPILLCHTGVGSLGLQIIEKNPSE